MLRSVNQEEGNGLEGLRGSLRRRILELRNSASGVWSGELSSSALSTALASAAMSCSDVRYHPLAKRGARWLVESVNSDGGWGDTTISRSNLSTTLIVVATLKSLSRRFELDDSATLDAIREGDRWVEGEIGGECSPELVTTALQKIYGKDKTFAVPILAFITIMSHKKEGRAGWSSVPPLPFLLALLPQRLYRFMRLQVVSYAVPALIAVGLCRHLAVARESGKRGWGISFAPQLLRQLQRLQPEHGGYLDAAPLTAFVVLSLIYSGFGDHEVVAQGLKFLFQGVRSDGSWPIDSNLRTWVTTQAVRSVWGDSGGRADSEGGWRLDAGGVEDGERVARWLLQTQLKERHPFTGAAPGGWAWTDLPGGVPDADDTSGAMVALKQLARAGCRVDMSSGIRAGGRWLQDMQNSDGGMPTFCRGWGYLPFDRSCPDISAHALLALVEWRDQIVGVERSIARLLRYLVRSQESDGSWVPLWFGHPDSEGGQNPIIGTSRTVDALRVALLQLGGGSKFAGAQEALARGENWLVERQRSDGGWSMGKSATVEESALAVMALAGGSSGEAVAAVERGVAWLKAQGVDGLQRAAPLGLYFALLWYHEQLYPLAWSLEALNRVAARG